MQHIYLRICFADFQGFIKYLDLQTRSCKIFQYGYTRYFFFVSPSYLIFLLKVLLAWRFKYIKKYFTCHSWLQD